MTEKKNENVEQEAKKVADTPAQEEKKASEKVEEKSTEKQEDLQAEETAQTPKEETAEAKAEETEKETAPAEEKAEKEEEPAKEEKAEETPKAEETKEETKAEPVEAKVEETSKEPEEFDWDSLESGIESYSDKEKEELEKLYDDTLNTVSEKEVLEGTVISMSKREVVVDIGYKSDGIVSLNEFRYNPDLKVGDKVDVYIESLEDKKGQMILSHKKARATRSWERVNESLEKDEIIKGYIKCRTKGGMIVDVFGIEAFLPGSQIDVKPIRDYDVFVGKTMEFKVVKINHEYRNVVVSHKALIEAELEQQKKEIIAKLEKGQVLEGTVKNITSYGVFMDLGGVDGLIHITDLSWGRISHPSEIVELDQKLNVVILDFDDDKKRIALGLKQLTPHPWDKLDEELKVGDKVKGKVVVLADYGAFVEIAPGVEGLIHVSEMSWSQHLRSAQDFLKVGDEVEAVILTLDREERKMSLGMKQLKEDPWGKIEENYGVGTKHKAIVRNFTNFGVFVEITEGVDGLIHISDLSWTKKIKHPSEFTSVGEEIEVVVLDIDAENRRLSLGHKQLEENPWEVFETIFTTDSIHEGTVVDLMDKGAVVALPYGVEGFATPRHLVKEDGTQAKQDEKLDFKVIEFNKSAKRIIVSHSRVFEDVKRAEDSAKRKTQSRSNKKAMKSMSDNIEKTTLGDISDLAALKSQMEKDESKKSKEDKESKESKDKKDQNDK
ncbi:SSU ribosomal protein S1P [Tangfeifania diversioriginum]|uniref:Small ribosomal subunit protein bS1 n=1 Tax=Tangfeifania diversioriginum TaxID=1168035 RepID=A0A1M6LDS0_9BACT|nr:30S ribosomal protein S1 [Tangfeifania diversioriginum]SHJ69344.1 SSU ribosomal protein S1P [Tangfeifania diversioriginum]